jgi:hypothetical protein
MSRELVRLGAFTNVLHGRVDHAVDNAGDGEDTANDGAELRQKVKERAPTLLDLHHDWRQVVEKVHAGQRALILNRLLVMFCHGVSGMTTWRQRQRNGGDQTNATRSWQEKKLERTDSSSLFSGRQGTRMWFARS